MNLSIGLGQRRRKRQAHLAGSISRTIVLGSRFGGKSQGTTPSLCFYLEPRMAYNDGEESI